MSLSFKLNRFGLFDKKEDFRGLFPSAKSYPSAFTDCKVVVVLHRLFPTDQELFLYYSS